MDSIDWIKDQADQLVSNITDEHAGLAKHTDPDVAAFSFERLSHECIRIAHEFTCAASAAMAAADSARRTSHRVDRPLLRVLAGQRPDVVTPLPWEG